MDLANPFLWTEQSFNWFNASPCWLSKKECGIHLKGSYLFVDQSKKGTQNSDCFIGRHNFFDVHENKKIKLKDNNQNNADAANNISNYLVACNQTTEIIDVDNNQGIDDDNKSNVHVTEIIDVNSKNIDVKTKRINVV